MAKRVIQFLGLLISLIILFFIFVPSKIDAVSWTPDEIPARKGQFEANTVLDRMEKLYGGQCHMCEDVAIDSAGTLFAGQENGDIVRFSGGQRTVVVNTGGRPLGLDFDSDGNLIIADAVKGLLSYTSSGELHTLVTEHDGTAFLFTDDVEVGPDGRYYFTDASSKYGFSETILDLLEHGGHGRLLVYDPATGRTDLLMKGLQFANGVAVSADTSFVLVNETGLYCVNKYWLRGAKAGQFEKIMPNLPGYPDNISRGRDGIYWLTLVAPRDPAVERLSRYGWLRNLISKLPPAISEPKPKYYGMILGVDGNGNVLYNFQDPDPNVKMITSVQQFGDGLFMGSLVDDGIGRMSLE